MTVLDVATEAAATLLREVCAPEPNPNFWIEIIMGHTPNSQPESSYTEINGIIPHRNQFCSSRIIPSSPENASPPTDLAVLEHC